MQGRTLLLSICMMTGWLAAGCAPSRPYLDAAGFYSDQVTQEDVERAVQAGSAKDRGRFTVDASACGLYSTGLADALVMVPTLRERMLFMGGNAVREVKASERVIFVAMAFIALPMACGDWTITGDVVYVDPPPLRPPAEE